MDSNNDIHQLFPVPRYFDCGEFNFYYPYGNTPAEDFLENVSPHSIKEPNILVLGCGDIRSCFYTLWKHFTSSSGSSCGPIVSPLFSGVHFVLNDHSAAVLARNVIFLHLCLQKPMEASSEDFKKWLCGLWAIWFSRNLLPAHERMLDSALRDLLKYAVDTKSWASQENPLSSFVQFSSERTLSEIRDMWRVWSTRSIDIKAISDKQATRIMFSTSQNSDIENIVGSAMSICLSSYTRERMECEIQQCSIGNSFAEYVVNDEQYSLPRTLKINLTMYGASDGKFAMDSFVPFRCFHHGFQFSPSQVRLNCNDEMLLSKLTVADEKFEQFPLLANSVQQFALWLSSASAFLSNTHALLCKQCSSFTFHCSDATAFCNELQNPEFKLRVEREFDVIYTSNLLDHVYPPNLVLFAIPLLKSDSYLLTTTIKYKTQARTTQEYLENTFGVDNKMLPMLFGVRCINHEGDQYKNTVSIRPAPIEVNAFCPEFTPYYMKVLIWEKVPSMVVSNVPPDSNLWRALYSSVSAILSLPPTSLNPCSSQTVVKMLQAFLSHVSADDSDGQFWDPLCTLLKHNKDFGHLMNALQTHSMLSGLHLHLNVTSQTCPVCNKIALSKYFSQICLSVKPLTQFALVNIYAQVHKSKEHHFSQYSTFDCLASQNDGNSLRLQFIIPLSLCESGYYVSIVGFEGNRPPSILTTGPLKSFIDSAITYSFSNIKTQNRLPNTSLGSVSSHYGNGDTFESVIQLSDIGYEAYSNSKKIYPEQLSPTSINLSCGIHNLELSYPHPIDFNTLTLTISRSRRTVKININATRTCHKYEDEVASVFLVDPGNILTLPRLNLDNHAVGCLVNMQFSGNEQSTMSTSAYISRPPLPDLKNCINIIMLQTDEMYFTFADPSESLYVMVMVVNRVFDYQLKAPAIDLVYCETTMKATILEWIKLSSCIHVIRIGYDTVELMKKTFLYFSRRTICSIQTLESLLALQRDVDSSFKRAVVYPLYGDADDIVHNRRQTQLMKLGPSYKEEMIQKMTEALCCSICGMFSTNLKRCNHCQAKQFCDECQRSHLTEHTLLCEKKSKTKLKYDTSSNSPKPSSDLLSSKTCGYCHKSSAQLKKCSRCHSVLYCNQDCQKKHWKEHKTSCYKQPAEKSSSCSYCNTVSSQLKRCTVCLSAQYCNRECQQKHWNEHKLHCSKPEDESTSQTKLSDFEQDETKKCSFCSRVAKDLKKCTRCLGAQYCNKTCQQKHWPDHKIICQSKPS